MSKHLVRRGRKNSIGCPFSYVAQSRGQCVSFVFSHLKILWATMALTEQQLREDPMILYWISGRGWMVVFANPTENLCPTL